MEGKVLMFIFVAIVLLTAVFSKEATGEKSPGEWERFRRIFWGNPSFFAGDQRPTGLPNTATRGREIQQKLPTDPANAPPYFVSCFDPHYNNAFYSAYIVTPEQAAKLGKYSRNDINTDNWRTPDVPGLNNAYSTAITDTAKSPLSRGHMNPLALNTFSKSYMRATLTLSNAVPQFETSNSGPWETIETRIRNYAKEICGPRGRGGTLYLLTGKSDYGVRIEAGSPVQDNTIRLPYTRKRFPGNVQLNTPRAVWTAGCCVWKEHWWSAKRAESFAVISNNMDKGTLLHQTEMSVSKLEEILRPPLLESDKVDLFPGNTNCRRVENDITLPPYNYNL